MFLLFFWWPSAAWKFQKSQAKFRLTGECSTVEQRLCACALGFGPRVRSTSLKGPRLLEGPNHDEWHPKTNLMNLDSNRTILTLIGRTVSFFFFDFCYCFDFEELRPPALDSAFVLISLIFAEKVGQKSIIDLLAISFALSRPRRIGHILIRVCRSRKGASYI